MAKGFTITILFQPARQGGGVECSPDQSCAGIFEDRIDISQLQSEFYNVSFHGKSICRRRNASRSSARIRKRRAEKGAKAAGKIQRTYFVKGQETDS